LTALRLTLQVLLLVKSFALMVQNSFHIRAMLVLLAQLVLLEQRVQQDQLE
jgi:hypothetical protein